VKQAPKQRPTRVRTSTPLRFRDLPQVVRVALVWAAAWGVVGLVVGILLMLGRAALFAESGARGSSSILTYVFWIPTVGAGAAAAGLGIGLVFACLMGLTSDWRDSLEGNDLMVTLGPDVLCGAAAGLIPGFLVGGLAGALFFAALGAASAAAMNRLQAARQDELRRRSASAGTSQRQY
jgi:hypothetical protein